MLMIVVLKSWSENSSVSALSDSDVCSVSWKCVFLPFAMPHNVFSKRAAYKEAFRMG